nr:immunoglobulin heavy chain junction region [Macaca mulatta]
CAKMGSYCISTYCSSDVSLDVW